MMDIPFVRFAFPLMILYLFYWALTVEPYVPEEAEEETKATLSLKETRALLAKAKALEAQNKFQEAIVPLTRLREIYPENHIYIGQLADIYHQLEDYKQEAEMWEKFLTYAPLPYEGCPQIGKAYQAQGLKKEARHAFERCLAMDEQDSDSLFFLGHAVETDGEYDLAAKLYRRGLQVSPRYPDLILGLARIQVRRGELADAKKGVDSVLVRKPNNVDALLVAGLVAWRSGDYAQARRYLERGMQLSPGYDDFRQVLARVNRAEFDEKKATAKPSGAGGRM